LIVRSVESHSEVRYEDLSPELIAEWHPTLGCAVLNKWGMEPIVCAAVGQQRDYARQSERRFDLTDLLIASVTLTDSLLDFNGDLVLCGGITAFERIDLDEDELKAILTHTEHSLEALRATLM
jgi:hypothetical protein